MTLCTKTPPTTGVFLCALYAAEIAAFYIRSMISSDESSLSELYAS